MVISIFLSGRCIIVWLQYIIRQTARSALSIHYTAPVLIQIHRGALSRPVSLSSDSANLISPFVLKG